MSKKPKLDHDYDADKDKLTITIHRYSLKSKKTRNAIIQKLMANLEGASDHFVANAKKKSNKRDQAKGLRLRRRNDVRISITRQPKEKPRLPESARGKFCSLGRWQRLVYATNPDPITGLWLGEDHGFWFNGVSALIPGTGMYPD